MHMMRAASILRSREHETEQQGTTKINSLSHIKYPLCRQALWCLPFLLGSRAA